MKKIICQFLFQSLVYNSFSYFNTLHAKDYHKDQLEKKELTRNNQPINIVNLSLSTSTSELKQLLSTLNQIDAKHTSYTQTGKETLQQVSNSLSELINRNKYWIYITTATCIYCSIFYKISQVNKLLNTPDAWCNWKPDLNLSKLLSIPQKDLALELIAAIQKKYSDVNNPTNFVTPMVNFINDINIETQELEKYVKIVNLIKKIKLKSIYPISDEKLDHAKEKINKLAYIKNIFSEWSVEFKQNQLLSISNTQSTKNL